MIELQTISSNSSFNLWLREGSYAKKRCREIEKVLLVHKPASNALAYFTINQQMIDLHSICHSNAPDSFLCLQEYHHHHPQQHQHQVR